MNINLYRLTEDCQDMENIVCNVEAYKRHPQELYKLLLEIILTPQVLAKKFTSQDAGKLTKVMSKQFNTLVKNELQQKEASKQSMDKIIAPNLVKLMVYLYPELVIKAVREVEEENKKLDEQEKVKQEKFERDMKRAFEQDKFERDMKTSPNSSRMPVERDLEDYL